MNERRIHRLESQIKARVAELLLRDLRDPKIGMVTISRVELDKEFTQCRVYWSVLGGPHQKAATDRALQRARGYVQREVGATLHTRTVPHLEFRFDESIAGAVKMQQTLEELRREREERTGEVEPPLGADAPPPDRDADPEAGTDAGPDPDGPRRD
ncbi:MAG: 30S ribosome-binding factor RbfA [Planctomycetota bacterium]